MRPPQPPTEPGLFREEPFAHFLVRALDARVGGALVVQPPGGPSCVVQLKRGIPRRVRCEDNFALFGGVLVNAGVVTSTQIERALCDPGLVGEALVALGHIDERTLEWALARQLILRTARIFGFPPATTFVFREGVDAFADTPGRAPRVDPLQILWVGLRTHAEASTRMHGALARIGRAPFTIRGDADVRRFGFSGDAVQVVEVIQRGRVTLQDLVAARLAPEPLCRALVYALSLSRYLDVAPVAEIVDEESTDDASQPHHPDAPPDVTAHEARPMRSRSATPLDLVPQSPAARGERAVYPTESPWQAHGPGHGPPADPPRRPPERPSQSGEPHARTSDRYSQTGERAVRPSERPSGQSAPDERPSRSSERPGPTGERSVRPSERPSQAGEVPSAPSERPSQSGEVSRDTRSSEERIVRPADRASQSDTPAPPSSDRAARPSSSEGVGEPSSDGAAPTPKRQVAKIKLRRMAVRRAPPAPTAGGPGARPALPPPAFEEVATRVAQLEDEGPFDLLDLDADALAGRSETEVADLLLGAYEECSRRWDPRHYPEDLAEMRVAVSRVHRAMRDAFLELSDPPRRAEAIARLAPPSSGGEVEDEVSSSRPRPILGDGDGREHAGAPPALYARALAAFQSGRFADALRLCEQACTGDPENPDYAAMAAWLRAHQPDADLAVVALDLDDVLHAYEDHVAARYYRALVRDRLGERGEARRDLERILVLEPNHADAKRKLAEWRDVGSTTPSRQR